MQNVPSRIPIVVKIVYTAFMAVLVPYYWNAYGPTNFLYFCDICLFMALGALWLENSLLASAAAVGIVVPQLFWQIDFLAGLAGLQFAGMTAYMFNENLTLLTRGLSFFHFWIPLLLLWIIARLGYDRRGLPTWTVICWCAILISYLLLPPPPAPADQPNLPVNVNYVYGLSDQQPQTFMGPNMYVALMMLGLPLCVFLPTHLLLSRFFRPARESVPVAGTAT